MHEHHAEYRRLHHIGSALALTLAACSGGCPGSNPEASTRATSGWKPDWIATPPPLPPGVIPGPASGDAPGEILLQWKSGAVAFGYEMHNKVRIDVPPGQMGSISTEATGAVTLSPVDGAHWEMMISSSLGAAMGGGPSVVRQYIVDGSGRLENPDPFAQSSLDLMMPLLGKPLVPGIPVTLEVTVSDPSGGAETRGTTTIGIVGFASVAGRPCAVVALDHSAEIWVSKGPDAHLERTGSVTHIKLMGWFDNEAGRYIAVSLQETSSLVKDKGERKTERQASYVLTGLNAGLQGSPGT